MLLKLQVFVILLVSVVVLEIIAPRRINIARKIRWPGNWGIFILNSIMLLLLPFSAIGASVLAISYKTGLFFLVEFAFWSKVIICMLVLDLVIYWQHRLFHKIPVMWKLHRVHHTDINFDMTTALRFHPAEIAMSVLIKVLVIIVLGAPLLAVLLFEIILNGMAIFNHSNIKIPSILDDLLRRLVVTPDMHRIHHSVHADEHNSNYGFCISLWDFIFGSYKAQPIDGHQKMEIGLAECNMTKDQSVFKLLFQPFNR